MADGYLESHYAEYEKKKAEWLKKKNKLKNKSRNNSDITNEIYFINSNEIKALNTIKEILDQRRDKFFNDLIDKIQNAKE